MKKRKNRSKIFFIKFLKNNHKVLKNFEERISNAEKFNREPWMMRSNPPMDMGDEILRIEAENL